MIARIYCIAIEYIKRIKGTSPFIVSLLLTAALLPLSIKAASFCVALNLLSWFFYKEKNFGNIKPALFFAALFFINLVGLLYTETQNMKFGVLKTESKLSLLIFPLIILNSRIPPRYIAEIIRTFSIAVVASCVITILKVFLFTPFNELSIANFTYGELYIVSGIHPTYMGAYIFIAITYFLNAPPTENDKQKTLKLAGLIFLLLYCILLSSRAILLSIIIFLIVSLFIRKEEKKSVLYLSLALIAGIISAITFVPELRDRFVHAVADIVHFRNKADDKSSSAGLHAQIWYCSLQQIDWLHLIQGYGTGDEKSLLSRCYLSNNWLFLYKENLDSHNEYLSQLIRHGLIGLGFFVANVVLPLRKAFKQKDMMYCGFLITIIVMGLFGSLNHLNGIIFYAFFNSLLFLTLQNKENSVFIK